MTTARRTVPAVLALIPPVYLIWLCITLHVDVPYWDAWELVPRLDRLDSGTLTLHDVWVQHNEHRPLFPVVLMLGLARVSGWNTGLEIATNLLLGGGIFLVFVRYLMTAWQLHGGMPRWLLPAISALVFTPFQWENWLWGWQITALMGSCSAVLGLYLLATAGEGRWRFAAALACGVWSTYSFAAGLVYWVIGVVAIALGARAMRRERAAAWAIVAGVTIASYFYDYHRPTEPSLASNFASIEAVRILVIYILNYLGAPIGAYGGSLAAVAGAAVAAMFVALVIRLWPLRHDPVFLFPVLIGLQTLGVACISASGRAWLGTAQALASRYGTITVPLWCAVAALAVLLLRAERQSAHLAARRGVVVAVTVTVLACAGFTGAQGSAAAAAHSAHLRSARRGLIVGQSDVLLRRLYPDVTKIKHRRAILRMLRMSVFRRGV